MNAGKYITLTLINFGVIRNTIMSTRRISSGINICSGHAEHAAFLAKLNPSAVFVLTDENTSRYCLPKTRSLFQKAMIIRIKSGEAFKNLETCKVIWKALLDHQADRQAVLINMGGGVICDMGSFCASTYKRGIRFINYPTTTLAICDAAIGGKTGIDFSGYKNMIGTMSHAEAVFMLDGITDTLAERQILSGSAEMFKHALLAGTNEMKPFLEKKFMDWDAKLQGKYFLKSIKYKSKIVKRDPFDNDIRKTLNLGHTLGHALESCFLVSGKSILHGEAVALGLAGEAFIASNFFNLKPEISRDIMHWYNLNFTLPALLKSVPANDILRFMQQDKKNRKDSIRMALLKKPGKAEFDIEVDKQMIIEAIAFIKSLKK
jgi:3-dehydroquinate synthase